MNGTPFSNMPWYINQNNNPWNGNLNPTVNPQETQKLLTERQQQIAMQNLYLQQIMQGQQGGSQRTGIDLSKLLKLILSILGGGAKLGMTGIPGARNMEGVTEAAPATFGSTKFPFQ